jgi:hypothetical protein
MAEYTGQNTYLAFNGVVYSTDYRNVDIDESVELIDASAGSDAWRTKVSTLRDGVGSWEYLEQDGGAGTAQWANVAPDTSGTLEIGREGTASGDPRTRVTVTIKKRARKNPYADLVVISVEFEYNDADGPTEDTYP